MYQKVTIMELFPKVTFGTGGVNRVNIRGIRKMRHLTQQEFSEKIGVTRASISRYESGDRTPPLPVLKKIAGVLGVTIDELVESVDKDECSSV